MPNNIKEDHRHYRDIVAGRVREELKNKIKSGKIFRTRAKDGKFGVNVPTIEIPHIVYGKQKEGVGRGPGNEGDVVGDDNGDGKGNKPGKGSVEGTEVQVELQEILNELKKELKLPDLKQKPNPTFEEEKIVYNGLSKTGPNALLHRKKTLLQTMKRMSASGEIHKHKKVVGFDVDVPVLLPNNDDRRYRQWNIVRKPSSNAAIFFMRDGSGSMDNMKCDIVSDIAYWLDLFIASYYKKTESVYIWHDEKAKEVSKDKFYKDRMGGGTLCSSALNLMKKLIRKGGRFDPSKWNIYAFYFGDGENWGDDNKKFTDIIKQHFTPEIVNLFGSVQVLAYGSDTLKAQIDKDLKDTKNVRSTEVKRASDSSSPFDYYKEPANRDEAVMNVLRDLLGEKAPVTA